MRNREGVEEGPTSLISKLTSGRITESFVRVVKVDRRENSWFWRRAGQDAGCIIDENGRYTEILLISLTKSITVG